MDPQTSPNSIQPKLDALNEWVEIVEPKSKKKIYANLETGICAKNPPDGATISRSEDFSDHWWELYDKKTGKYYYYNPEQQRTVWTRPKVSPTTNGNRSDRKLLIIPVSRLQTFKKLPSNEENVEKRDASTQTIASDLVSIGTQTISESAFEDEFNAKLNFIDISADPSRTSSYTHSSISKRFPLNHRQHSDFGSVSSETAPTNNFIHQGDNVKRLFKNKTTSFTKDIESSQQGPTNKKRETNGNEDSCSSYFGLPPSYRSDCGTFNKLPSGKLSHNRTDELPSSTSTFGIPQRPPVCTQKPTQVSTNNLSHYLVREARAMGIALISDDEIDDDEHETDDDCGLDEDEDTDLHDDASSQHEVASDLNASQDLGEDSSEGWKSFSDQDSPNGTFAKSCLSIQKSPIHCETATPFTFNHLIDDEKDPATCMSQQLDHRKLVENFKKSRQNSSFGLQDSLGRSYKLDANHAVQRIKTVADSYFNYDKDRLSERHLRQLSTLSTLPRPHKGTKDKIALSKRDDAGVTADADYDVVEENCGYYSDSEQLQVQNQQGANVAAAEKIHIQANQSGEPSSPIGHFDRNKTSRGSTFSVESFARENLTRHPKKGSLLFNRKVKWSRMISWTKKSIKQPMISSVSSDLSSESIASFKLIQQFMGDRKVTINKRYRQILAKSGLSDEQKESHIRGRNLRVSSSSIVNGPSLNPASNVHNVPDRLRDELAYELVVKGCTKSNLRDEIYVQMARQLTENPSAESVRWGMILMSILFSYFSPSSKFSPFLLSFLEMHSHQMARDVCLPRLEKRLRQNWITYCRKPVDGKEISIVRLSITKWPQYCGVFGESLEKIMSLQTCSPYLKTLRLPWILTTLGEKLIETDGLETEGIFRCAADHDVIAQLRLEIDCVDFRKITDAKQVYSLLSNVQDPHVIAGLLKLFFRQLQEPVFPSHLYEICLQSGQDNQLAYRVFNERLSNLNKDVVAYLIRLLQLLAKPEKVAFTKMDSSNLSMVWAPNLLRAPNQDDPTQSESRGGSKWSIANGSSEETHQPSLASSQSVIFERTRQEMQFIRSLIVHLDTSFIDNVI